MARLSIEPNEHVTFKIRHQDDDIVVVDKPAHLVTQPGLGHTRDSLLNGLFARWGTQLQNLGKDRDFGLLHRLDKETSGLLVLALRASAYDAMRKAFEERKVKKFYWAIVKQAPSRAEGVIRRPIIEVRGEDETGTDRQKLARLSAAGKPAITAYRVLQTSVAAALVECRPVTGRLHQVRVHLDAIGCGILGDGLYGSDMIRHASRRLALHAHRLIFTHPATGETIDAHSPWPNDLRSVLAKVGLKRPDIAETSASPSKKPVDESPLESADE
jgi:23S rRNA pseudouridine1911/1915/1917 synthase